jgi:signal transduction histidine kinase
MISEGSAFLDRSGRVLAADATFRACLRLPAGDATAALRERAAGDPALAALLGGAGPDAVHLAIEDGADCAITRTASDAGFLLRARGSDAGLPEPVLEHAMLAIALSRLAGSVAHEVKNPLNAMALQLALLGDKIASASDALASTCAANLASLKNQIGRVNEVVRRFVEVSDPAPSGSFDVGSLLADATTLFGHEARRRRIVITCEAAPDSLRATGDPARVARLLLGVLMRALTGTPEGGRLLARALPSGADAVLAIEHGRGAPDRSLAWMGEVVGAAAAEMGGRLEESTAGDVARVALVLPRERPL